MQTPIMRHATHKRFMRGVSTLLALGALAGVLIWAKLRLSTDIPRSAIAEPDDESDRGDRSPARDE